MEAPVLIEPDADYLSKLQALVLPEAFLLDSGYVLSKLRSKDFEKKKRCQACGKCEMIYIHFLIQGGY